MNAINRLERRRNISLIAAAIAWPLLIGIILLDPVPFSANWPLWAQVAGTVLGLVVLNVAIFGLVVALYMQGELRAFARFKRGEAVVARWTVSPEAWQAFLGANARRDAEGVNAPNLLQAGMTCPPEGLACVATRDAVMIGEDFHDLGMMGMVSRVGWLNGPPISIEVDAVVARGGTVGGTSLVRLRFPVDAAGKAGADIHAAWLYRAGLIGNPGASGNPLRRRNIALLALLLGIGLAAVPIAVFGADALLDGSAGGPVPLLLIPAIFLVAFGLGLALRFHLDSRRAARLAAGGGVIGRWRLDAGGWAAFLEAEALRRQNREVGWNLVDAWTRPKAVVVTVGTDTVMVDEHLFHIPSFAAGGVTGIGWLDDRPACIEIRGIYHARTGAFSRFAAPSGDRGPFTIRFPVAPGSEEIGRKALDVWRTRYPAT